MKLASPIQSAVQALKEQTGTKVRWAMKEQMVKMARMDSKAQMVLTEWMELTETTALKAGPDLRIPNQPSR